MSSFLEAVGRFVGAILAIFVLGVVLSFLGCDTSDGPGYTPDTYIPPDPPVLTDPLPPLPTYDLPPPPPPPDLNQ